MTAQGPARTWDGLEIATDNPIGCTVVVRRPGACGEPEYLLLHRAHHGPDYAGDWAWTPPSGCRQPGEPVYTAALRELVEETGLAGQRPWAVDLARSAGNGEPARWAAFAVDVPRDISVELTDPEHDRFEWVSASAAAERLSPAVVATTVAKAASIPDVVVGFRPMTYDDLPDVVRWVTTPHVQRWWDDESTDLDGAERHYGPGIDGDDPTRMWIVELGGVPAGFVQDYRIGDHPEYAALTSRPDAIGIDYAIGAAGWVGRGVGTRLLWTYLRDVVRPAYPDATHFHAAPDHRNVGSLRVLHKLGFVAGPPFEETQRDGRVDTVIGCTLDVRHWFG